MKARTSAIVVSLAASLATAANFTTVDLDPPLNWVVGPYLWPAEIIAGYNVEVASSDYTDETWDAYVLAACETYTACTSSITWQGWWRLEINFVYYVILTSSRSQQWLGWRHVSRLFGLAQA